MAAGTGLYFRSPAPESTADGCWGCCRFPRRPRDEPLFEVLGGMDQHASPQQPLRASVWISLLAAPLLAEASSGFLAPPPPSLTSILPRGVELYK